jgi:hypothetical protein
MTQPTFDLGLEALLGWLDVSSGWITSVASCCPTLTLTTAFTTLSMIQSITTTFRVPISIGSSGGVPLLLLLVVPCWRLGACFWCCQVDYFWCWSRYRGTAYTCRAPLVSGGRTRHQQCHAACDHQLSSCLGPHHAIGDQHPGMVLPGTSTMQTLL